LGHRVCRWDGRPRGLRTRLQLFHVDNAATWTTADVCSDGSVVGRRWPCRHGRPSPAHPPRSPQIARQHATTAIPAAIVSKAAESRRRRSPPGRLGGRIPPKFGAEDANANCPAPDLQINTAQNSLKHAISSKNLFWEGGVAGNLAPSLDPFPRWTLLLAPTKRSRSASASPVISAGSTPVLRMYSVAQKISPGRRRSFDLKTVSNPTAGTCVHRETVCDIQP